MKNFLKNNGFKNIEFLQNNSFIIENKIICGTRGWGISDIEQHNEKILKREAQRLEMSIKDGIEKNNQYSNNLEIIVFMHYPPITKQNINTPFMEILKKYNIKRCYYAHLHGKSLSDAVEGKKQGIEFKLVSADKLDFKLLKI